MSNPIDLSAVTLNKVLIIMSKVLRIQPLIFIKSLGVFVEEVGEEFSLIQATNVQKLIQNQCLKGG